MNKSWEEPTQSIAEYNTTVEEETNEIVFGDWSTLHTIKIGIAIIVIAWCCANKAHRIVTQYMMNRRIKKWTNNRQK